MRYGRVRPTRRGAAIRRRRSARRPPHRSGAPACRRAASGTMAGKAAVGEDRTDVAIEFDRLGGECGDEQ